MSSKSRAELDVPDEQLVEAFLRGEDRDRVCHDLVQKYWKVLVAWIQIRVRNIRDAEDIAQDTLAKAFRSLPELRNPGCFAAWTFRIAGNLTSDFLRRRRGTVSLDTLVAEGRVPEAPRDGLEVQQDLEQEELFEHVLEAVARLPERYRLAITLRYFLGMSARDIARQLGEPEGTIRNRVFRAIARLKRELDFTGDE